MRQQDSSIPRYRDRGTSRGWSEADNDELREMAGHYSVDDIAVEFGVSAEAVRKQASKINVSLAFGRNAPRPLTQRELDLGKQILAQHGMKANRLSYVLRMAEQMG